MEKKPNFLIVGAAKSGSTSLYQYLIQHPEVFMPINKEPNYFVADYQKKMSKNCPSYHVDMKRMVFEREDYFNLFKKVDIKKHKAIGEASVTYLFRPDEAITSIKKELGDPKILIILRNPIKRAFSHYSYACELGFEKLTFGDALDKENERLNNNWSSTFAYVNQGMYYNQVKAYKEAFSNVHVLILDDFLKNKQLELKNIYKFLGIDLSFKNSFSENYNVSGVPKSKLLHKYLVHDNFLKRSIKLIANKVVSDEYLRKTARKARNLNQGKKMKLGVLEQQKLKINYKKDILLLSKLIKTDLTDWLK